MKRLALVLASMTIAASPACGRNSEQRFEQEFTAARLAMLRGELPEAQSLADRAIERTQSQADSVRLWQFRLLRAEIALLQANTRDALPFLTADLPAGVRFDELRARQKCLDAKRKVAEGRLEDALETLESGRSIGVAASDARMEIEIQDGEIRARLGRWSEADSRLREVAKRSEEASDSYHRALALNNLGMSRLVRGRYDEALPFFESVLSFNTLSDFSVYAASLSNAGTCYARLGDFDRAIRIERQALAIHDRHEHGPRRHFAQALGQLGNLYVLRGDAPQSIPYYERALAVAKSANLIADAQVWARNLANAYLDLQKWDEAERFSDEAIRLSETTHNSAPVLDTLIRAVIAAGRGRFDQATRSFEDALRTPDAPPSVRWTAQAGLARVAMALEQPARAALHFEAALDTIEKTRSGLLKTDYQVSYLSQLITFYREYVQALVDQGKTDRALEIADSSRGRVLAERQRIAVPARGGASAFRQLARQSGAVILSYWLAPTKSYLWVVAPSGITCLALPPAKEIEALVHAHQATIANVLANPLGGKDTAGDKLYRLIVAPAARWLPPDASVVIVPDGALHGINFETLPVEGERRHYWIEDVAIQIAPSLAGVVPAKSGAKETTKGPRRPSGSLLLVGNPSPRPEFPALKYASGEMSKIAQHFGSDRVTSYDGDRASPSAYREASAGDFSYIHFTAHATANVDSPLDSAVILSGPDNAFKLYARDIASLPLSADLVTVSACRSAGERAYSGEGLVGFSWAFLRAGARRVIAGLWDVDDRSTSELMDRLYARLAAGDPPARALRSAKLDLLRSGGPSSAPYNWAPFELFTISL